MARKALPQECMPSPNERLTSKTTTFSQGNPSHPWVYIMSLRLGPADYVGHSFKRFPQDRDRPRVGHVWPRTNCGNARMAGVGCRNPTRLEMIWGPRPFSLTRPRYSRERRPFVEATACFVGPPISLLPRDCLRAVRLGARSDQSRSGLSEGCAPLADSVGRCRRERTH